MIEFLVYFLNQINLPLLINSMIFGINKIKNLKNFKKTLDRREQK